MAPPQAAHQAPPRRTELLTDTGVATAVFAASLVLLAVGAAAEDGGRGVDALGVALAALASFPLVARRVAPIPVFVVTALASTLLRGLADPVGPPIGATLALYWMVAASNESRARTRAMAALAATMLVAHVAASGIATDRFPATETLFGLLLWGAAWIAGERTRLRHERMIELEQRAQRAEREAERERRLAAAEERMRIARDLHDSAGHAINVILVHAGLGRLRAENDAPAREAFETIEEVARETVGEIDAMVRALREGAADESAEAVEPPPGIAVLEGLVERHRSAGLDVTATVRGEIRTPPPAVDAGAYRILQEALTNAARHGVGRARVELAFAGEEVELTVENPVDRGEPGPNGRGGHGVVGMHERAAMLGGSLEAGAVGGRFRVRARLPLAGRRT